MSLSRYHAEVLKELGFPQRSPAAGDFYEVGNEEWVVGGQPVPHSSLLIPSYVIEKGTWVPNILDLLQWLEQQSPGIKVLYNRTNYLVPRSYVDVTIKGTPIKVRGSSVATGLYACAEKVLLFNQNKHMSEGALKRLRIKWMEKVFKEKEQSNREN